MTIKINVGRRQRSDDFIVNFFSKSVQIYVLFIICTETGTLCLSNDWMSYSSKYWMFYSSNYWMSYSSNDWMPYSSNYWMFYSSNDWMSYYSNDWMSYSSNYFFFVFYLMTDNIPTFWCSWYVYVWYSTFTLNDIEPISFQRCQY